MSRLNEINISKDQRLQRFSFFKNFIPNDRKRTLLTSKFFSNDIDRERALTDF